MFKLMISQLCHFYFIFLDHVPYIFIGAIFNYIRAMLYFHSVQKL